MKIKCVFLFMAIFTFATSTVFGQGKPNTLESNYYLPPGTQLVSPNGEYTLIYQDDGNLVLYRKDKKVIWASNTDNTGKPGMASMDSDGNFVVYNADEEVVWASETGNNGPNCIVELNDNGEFEVIKKGSIDEVLYSSQDAGWGWNKPQTGEYDNWEVDMSFNYLALMDDLSGKSNNELEDMFRQHNSYCDDCIAIELGNRYIAEGDYTKGFIWIKKAADSGDERGSYKLANMYYEGLGTPVDYKKALSLYRYIAGLNEGVEQISALRENLFNVQNRIAAFYFFGYGVKKDVKKAKSLLKEAIENGSSAAQVNLNRYFNKQSDNNTDTHNSDKITNTGSNVTLEQAENIVDEHNRIRSDVGVGPVTWSNKLAAFAQDWADQLAANGCAFDHRPNNKYGENLFEGTKGMYTVVNSVEAWGSEKQDYTYGPLGTTPQSGVVGHYTQIIWRNTKKIGCGVAECNGMIIVVCNYDPSGNYTGEKPY
ncbi:D-mannose binding lectin [bacterium BMS3Abin03]|nr:D-mannose binding lectin [bacterium BMS3Abin03]